MEYPYNVGTQYLWEENYIEKKFLEDHKVLLPRPWNWNVVLEAP